MTLRISSNAVGMFVDWLELKLQACYRLGGMLKRFLTTSVLPSITQHRSVLIAVVILTALLLLCRKLRMLRRKYLEEMEQSAEEIPQQLKQPSLDFPILDKEYEVEPDRTFLRGKSKSIDFSVIQSFYEQLTTQPKLKHEAKKDKIFFEMMQQYGQLSAQTKRLQP